MADIVIRASARLNSHLPFGTTSSRSLIRYPTQHNQLNIGNQQPNKISSSRALQLVIATVMTISWIPRVYEWPSKRPAVPPPPDLSAKGQAPDVVGYTESLHDSSSLFLFSRFCLS